MPPRSAEPAGEHAGRRTCAVVGHPVAHSLSPVMHRAAYRALGLDWNYQAVDVAPGGLAAFVNGLDASWRGLSVTMPHKVDLVQLGTPDRTVHQLGVANTWVRTDDGAIVANTDVEGLVRACGDHGVEAIDRVVVVGAGATARSALAGAALMGATSTTIVSRSLERSGQALGLAVELGMECQWLPLDRDTAENLPKSDLLISTVPAAALEDLAEALVARAQAVFDVIYDPWPTPLARAAASAGRPLINGLDLLAGQAVGQIALMTGHQVPMELLWAAGRDELSARART